MPDIALESRGNSWLVLSFLMGSQEKDQVTTDAVNVCYLTIACQGC